MSTKKIIKMQIATGNVLKRHRKLKKLSQHEVGFLIYNIPMKNKNAAQQRVKVVESGNQALRVTDLLSYSNLFKIPPRILFDEILKEYNRLKNSD